MTYTQIAKARLSLNGLDCSGEDDDGVSLVFDTVAGWYGGAGVRSSFTPRPSDHGSFSAPVYRSELTPTFTGWAYADTRTQVAAKLMQFCACLANGSSGTVTVDDPDIGTLSITAQLAAAPQVAWDTNQQTWSWQFQVVAVDPLKYGPVVSVSTGLPRPGSGGLTFPLFGSSGKLEFGTPGDPGQVVLSNPGTADSWPRFTITGPVFGGVVLTDVVSGRRIVWSGDVPDGANLLIIDSASGHSYLNGSLRDSALTVKQWFPVPAGGSYAYGAGVYGYGAYGLGDGGSGTSVVQFSTLGASGQAGQLTASFAPAYW